MNREINYFLAVVYVTYIISDALSSIVLPCMLPFCYYHSLLLALLLTVTPTSASGLRAGPPRLGQRCGLRSHRGSHRHCRRGRPGQGQCCSYYTIYLRYGLSHTYSFK